jgi:hypothetical protein
MSIVVVPGSVLAGILWDMSKLVVSAIRYVWWRNPPCPDCEARRLIRHQRSAMHVKFSDEEDTIIISTDETRAKKNHPVHL